MSPRFLFPLALAVLASPALAEPPKTKTPMAVQFVVATLKDDQFTYEVTQPTTVTEYVSQQQQQGGKQVTVNVPVTKTVDGKRVIARPLSELKATGTTGQEIAPADLKEKLKGGGPVVLLAGPIGEEWRALFKTGTVFVEPKR